MRPRIIVQSIALVSGVVACVGATDLPFDWVTVGDPGNRAATFDEGSFSNEGRGSVDYAYRLSRTEVTVAQHRAFLVAIEPFVDDWSDDVRSVQEWFGQRMNTSLQITPGWENAATTMSYYTAARFCNWLHNGQVSEAWAFESGAYDVASFGTFDADGIATDRLIRQEGARFWIPNRDEWIKGVFWDPTKDGEGGYWTFPDGSDTALVPGFPGYPGAQTSAGPGDWNNPLYTIPIDAGSYPGTASFWGVLDASGGSSEWIEASQLLSFGPFVDGTGSNRSPTNSFILGDRLSFVGDRTLRPRDVFFGLRLASQVPSPGVVTIAIGALCCVRWNRRIGV